MASIRFFVAGSKADSRDFANKFGTDYLKIGPAVALTKENLITELPKFDSSTVVLIENGFSFGDDHAKFVETIKEKNASLLFKDSTIAGMRGYAAVCPEAPYVVVQSACWGRKQRVIVLGTNVTIETSTEEVQEKYSDEDRADQSIVEIKPDDISVPPAWHDQMRGKDTAASDDVLEMLANIVKDNQFVEVATRLQDQPYYWQHDTTLMLSSVDTPPITKKWNKGRLKSFYSLSISMYAVKSPTKKKYIQFKQTDACGVNVQMGWNDIYKRGFFNDSVETCIYPGTGADPYSSTKLPDGWIRPHAQPHTPNSQTTYTSTTGWSVGVSGGGSPDGPKADVTASYSQSDEVQTTINDFSVRNKSDGRMSGWEFYYTAMDGDNWKHHGHRSPFRHWKIASIADLAKSTLFLRAEAVYQGPHNSVEMINWSARVKAKYALLWSHGSIFKKHLTIFWNTFTMRNSLGLDLSAIHCPE